MSVYSNAILLRRITQSLKCCFQLWRSRRAMAGMGRAMLGDIGICAGAAEYEASRPFWDIARDDR